MKKLTALFNLPELKNDIELHNMVLDSRKVKAGDLFVAIKGHQVDGNQFIDSALHSGASAVVSETELSSEHLTVEFIGNVPVVKYHQLSRHLSSLADVFYDSPSKNLTLVGVTGTNGKTTISQLLAQWAELLGHRAAVMGTIGNGLFGQIVEAKNTTGSAVEIQSSLSTFKHAGADFTSIEVSSHGLAQHRVEALHFKAAIFTNLTRDHLDYHQSMENYAAAKKRLFTELDTQIKVINADDEIGYQWLTELPDAIAVSMNADFKVGSHQWMKAINIHYHFKGADITFESSWGNGVLHSPLIGAFNVSNLLLVMTTLLSFGYPLENLLATAKSLKGVCGRMEMIQYPNKPIVIVDYAHTPDALEKALIAAREHCQGELWCIFGCGGDRDRGKRPLMAQVAEQFAEKIIVTKDNPRTEPQSQIEADIVAGFKNMEKVGIIPDRAQAIQFAIESAVENDVILIAGKGHEHYQIIGSEVVHFSDQEIALDFLK
ncbi:TPA: UDP-N-acetylmuramoyl-L-alanyl-D-glutamate--2,6-diaminopimelate ligase [Haemophilus influenzae]|uniref:UDP-N-acetylmuramoyl-L-alanyl-D-glutamate--2, 6-diaminopimelate ligase n=1 Tax=Haemophilus influenzae TaxID=727 RepID=UPI003F7A4538